MLCLNLEDLKQVGWRGGGFYSLYEEPTGASVLPEPNPVFGPQY